MLCVVQSWVGPTLLTQNSEKAQKGGLDEGWMDRQTQTNPPELVQEQAVLALRWFELPLGSC